MDKAVTKNFAGPLLRPRSEHPGPWVSLPKDRPCDMPQQDFAAKLTVTREAKRRGYWVPRAAVFAGAGVLTAAFGHELFGILAFKVMTPLQFLFLILSTITFGWIALGSLSAALGFLPLFADETADTIAVPRGTTGLQTRTALLFPVYHEDPARIAATIEAMAGGLSVLNQHKHFDVFVLSDTRDKAGRDDAAKEVAVYRALREKLANCIPLYYRRRLDNSGKKAGNIGDWVQRFGGGYDHFIIFDGDSVMSAKTVVALARTMESDAKAGLIQTVPRLVGGETLLQRLQQFACNTYGPAVAAGIAFWHRDQGNYWGHNAILRTVAFASAAGLPDLDGRKPFGGHIMSHDFVEAVLLQRAGWGVHMMPTLDGSYEGTPPNIVDVVARDRRWAQGNLQHLAIAGQPGVTPMGRVHLGMGAMSYLISAVWALSLIVGLVLALQGQQMIPSYFQDSKTLFPIWPIIDPGAALRLFLATLAVVFLPKGLGLILEWKRALAARDSWAAIRATAGVFLETLYSMLIAPILMITQTAGSLQILVGRDAGWNAQSRGDGAIGFADAMRFARWHMVIGVGMAAIAWSHSLGLLAWMAPVILGLLLAGPMSWLTSRPAGRLARWALATQEELNPEPVVKDAAARFATWAKFATSVEKPLSVKAA